MSEAVPTSGPLTPAEQRTGMRYAYLSQALGSHLQLFLGQSAVAPLFIKHLGGSDLAAMLPSVFFGLANMIQIPIAILVRPRDMRKFLVRCWFASSIPIALALLVSLWFGPGAGTVRVVLGGTLCTQLLLYAGATFWFPLLHAVVPADQRGRFFGSMRAIWSTVFLVLGILAGAFLGSSPATWQFVVVLGVVTVMQFLREPCVQRIPCRVQPARAADDDRHGELRSVLKRRDLMVFLAYFGLLMFLAGFIGPPSVLYMERLGVSAGENQVIYALSTVGSVLALLVAGWLLDRVGTRRVFLWVHLVLCAMGVLLAVAGELPEKLAGPVIAALLIGLRAALAAAQLANTAQIFHLSPARGRAFYMSVGNAVMMLGGGLSPLVAGALCDSAWGTATLHLGVLSLDMFQTLFLAAGIGLLIAIVLLPYQVDVRPAGDGGKGDRAEAAG